MPGSNCVAEGTIPISVTATGGVENPSTLSTATALCPVERIATGGAFSTNFSARVWVVDQSSSGNVCCRVVSNNPGGAQQLGTPVCSTGSAATSQSLTRPGITDTASYSHFYVTCTIPAKTALGKTSGILTYRGVQN